MRLDQFLKVLANATSYGIFAEMNRQELPLRTKDVLQLYGLDGRGQAVRTSAPQRSGAFFFSFFLGSQNSRNSRP